MHRTTSFLTVSFYHSETKLWKKTKGAQYMTVQACKQSVVVDSSVRRRKKFQACLICILCFTSTIIQQWMSPSFAISVLMVNNSLDHSLWYLEESMGPFWPMTQQEVTILDTGGFTLWYKMSTWDYIVSPSIWWLHLNFSHIYIFVYKIDIYIL